MIARDRDTDGNGSLDERLYALADANFNVTALTNTSGVVQERYNYSPYGQRSIWDASWTARSSSSYGWHHGHQGLGHDPESNLIFNRARYRHPLLGRFISRDRLRYVDGMNLYQYVRSNPLLFVDPSGLAPNKDGVTNPSHVHEALKNNPNLEELRDAHGGNVNRYFYTDKYGWVDVRHFAEAARLAKEGMPQGVVEALGVGNEVSQWLSEWGDDYRSGFSPEDCPSNSAGAEFGASIKENETVAEAFERWAKYSGVRPYTDPQTGYDDLPQTDPSDKGGQGRGSSNPSSDPDPGAESLGH